ncbi:hypothetical protein WG906_06740 [Pedobacter sp. P351]|uniref:hypothetical protein n=1 Tax=Pedobacter superstes TaxID=3133441 RepID=UPI00309B0548
MIRSFTFLIFIVFLINSCTSGKKAMQQGNYDDAVFKAVKRLRNNTDHKKTLEILKQTYPLAQQWHLNRIKNMEISYDRFKWEPIAREYASLINLYEEISRCPACLAAVPAPESYSFEYERARLGAASERFDAGSIALEKGKNGDRNQARDAFIHFTEANNWVRNYKDSEQKIKDAEYYATIRVVVEPIPMHSQALKISNEFFDNKINEFLLQAPVNRFVKFYTTKEAKRLGITKPDQILQLEFDDFVVGQTYMHEKETQLIKDSIVLATYEVEVPQTNTSGQTTGNSSGNGGSNETKVTICHTAPGSGNSQTITVAESGLKAHMDHGDKIGSCQGSDNSPSQNTAQGVKKEVRKVYGQAKATVHIFTRSVESKGLLDLRIIDANTRRVISQEKLPGAFVWQSQWGYYNGDQRALEKQHQQIIKNKDVPPPSPQDLFIQFTQPIYQQITAKISDFYRNY